MLIILGFEGPESFAHALLSFCAVAATESLKRATSSVVPASLDMAA